MTGFEVKFFLIYCYNRMFRFCLSFFFTVISNRHRKLEKGGEKNSYRDYGIGVQDQEFRIEVEEKETGE